MILWWRAFCVKLELSGPDLTDGISLPWKQWTDPFPWATDIVGHEQSKSSVSFSLPPLSFLVAPFFSLFSFLLHLAGTSPTSSHSLASRNNCKWARLGSSASFSPHEGSCSMCCFGSTFFLTPLMTQFGFSDDKLSVLVNPEPRIWMVCCEAEILAYR